MGYFNGREIPYKGGRSRVMKGRKCKTCGEPLSIFYQARICLNCKKNGKQ